MHEYRDDELAQALSELPIPAASADFYDRLHGRITRTRMRPRRRILTSRWALVAALVAAAGLSIGGLALAGAFGPLHGARLVINPSTLGGTNGISTCDLIGKPADQVAAKLTSRGIGIEWRFMHWGTTVVPTGKGSPTGITGGGPMSSPPCPTTASSGMFRRTARPRRSFSSRLRTTQTRPVFQPGTAPASAATSGVIPEPWPRQASCDIRSTPGRIHHQRFVLDHLREAATMSSSEYEVGRANAGPPHQRWLRPRPLVSRTLRRIPIEVGWGLMRSY